MSDPSFQVWLCGASTPNPNDPLQQELTKAGCTLLFGSHSGDDVDNHFRLADAVVAGRRLSADNIERLERCRLIVRTGIGYDTIDVDAATRRGIVVVNVPDSWTEEVANHTMTLLLACHRRLLPLARYTKERAWGKASPERPIHGIRRLSEQTLGLIGLGGIGRAVTERARAFHMKVVATDPFVTTETASHIGVEMLDLDALLRRSDYVSIHTLLTGTTRHLLGDREFRLLKPTAYLINTARGGVIDEQALVTALGDGRLAGAALDVVEREPIADDHPFLGIDSIVLTPHAAYYSAEAVEWCQRQAAREIVSVMHGDSPRNVAIVNKEVLASANTHR